MKTGIFITARLGSSRLRKKHLLPVGGRPLMSYLLERIGAEFAPEITEGRVLTVIVSSDEPENREFERFADAGARVFYGSIDNIPLRHHQAALALGVDAIVAVDGDDILCSPGAMRAVYRALGNGTPYACSKGLPFGMNAFGYTIAFLVASLEGHREDVLETGWGKIFTGAQVTELALATTGQDNRLRFTLDYQEDYEFFSALIETLGTKLATADHEELVRVVEENSLYHLNQGIAEEYWANFYRCMEREMEERFGSKPGISA